MSISVPSSVQLPPPDLSAQPTSRPPAAEPREIAVEPSKAPKEPPKDEELRSAVSRIQDFVTPLTAELQFSIDDQSGLQIVKVVDTSNHQVIRQIPSEEAVEMARALERLQGLLLKQSA